MSAIVLQPRSLTNSSDKYRVVEFDEWRAVADGEKTAVATLGEFDSHAEASAFADDLNHPEDEDA